VLEAEAEEEEWEEGEEVEAVEVQAGGLCLCSLTVRSLMMI